MSNYQLPKTVPQEVFRAYDIRGVVTEQLTPAVVYAIGRSIASESIAQGQNTVIAGHDARLSAAELSAALVQGLLDSGADVIDLGMVPTPVLYYAANVLTSNSAVILTASHNPPQYNGLKIIINGTTLAEAQIQGLYKRIVTNQLASGQGSVQQQAIVEDYIAKICDSVSLKKPFSVVIDCANGMAGMTATAILERLGCQVFGLYTDVDGSFPNHPADPTHPENLRDLQKAVVEQQADLGFAFDGDGDRCVVVSGDGEIIWPDRVMMIVAEHLLQAHPGAEMIFDVKCTHLLPKLINRLGGKATMWRTGHSVMKAKLFEAQAILAGELSGHLFFNDKWYGFDDGVYVAARLLEVLSVSSRQPAEIFAALPALHSTPELQIAIQEDKKFAFVKRFQEEASFPGAELNKIDGLRVDYPDRWGLLRASNTTPKLTLRFEAESEQALALIKDEFKAQILAIDSSLEVIF